MSDISSRRRWSGRLLIGAAVLALPLTGSISYAQDEAAPASPAPPAAPAAPEAPGASIAPKAPLAPDAPLPPTAIDPDGRGADGQHRVVVRRIERDGQPVRIERRVYRGDRLLTEDISGELDQAMSAEDRAEFERDMKEHRKDMAELQRELAQSQAEIQRELAHSQAEIQRELAHSQAEIQREIATDQAQIQRKIAMDQAEIQREIRLAVAEAHRARPKVRVRCRDGQRDVAETVTTRDGETIFVCQAIAMAEARKGLAAARAEIARSHDLTKKERAKALWAVEHAERGVRAD